jgi:hypothetical protein
MNDLSRLANIAEIIGALIVIGGLFFAILQMRHLRQQRRELAAIELFRFFGNPNFADAYRTILQLPDGMSAEDIRNHEGYTREAAMLISTTMENIGVMTYQRIVPFAVVSNLIGVSTIVLWRKLENWVQAIRDDLDQPAAFEWFQWLADRLEQHAVAPAAPAYEAYRDWQPSNVTQEF